MSTALPNKPLFRIDEVAQFLDVPKRTVYSWHQIGSLDTVKLPGRTIRVRREEIVRIITASTE